MKPNELWWALKSCWINVNLGPLDINTHDDGTNFVARAFQENSYDTYQFQRSSHGDRQHNVSCGALTWGPTESFFNCAWRTSHSRTPSLGFEEHKWHNKTWRGHPHARGFQFNATPRHTAWSSRSWNLKTGNFCGKFAKEISPYFVNKQVRDARKQTNGPDVTYIRVTPLRTHFSVYRELDKTTEQVWQCHSSFWTSQTLQLQSEVHRARRISVSGSSNGIINSWNKKIQILDNKPTQTDTVVHLRRPSLHKKSNQHRLRLDYK